MENNKTSSEGLFCYEREPIYLDRENHRTLINVFGSLFDFSRLCSGKFFICHWRLAFDFYPLGKVATNQSDLSMPQ